MNLMWLSHTRPECMFEILQLTKVNKEHFGEDRTIVIKVTNCIVKYAVATQSKYDSHVYKVTR